jgi:hypothetical protein
LYDAASRLAVEAEHYPLKDETEAEFREWRRSLAT